MTLGAGDNQTKTVFCYVASLPISPCHWDIIKCLRSVSLTGALSCVLPPQAGEQLKRKGEAETGEDSVSSPAAPSLLATFGHFLIPSPSIPHLPKMERRPLESPFPESLLVFYFFLPWSPLSAKAGPSHCPSPSTCIHSSRPHPSPWPPAMRDEGWGWISLGNLGTPAGLLHPIAHHPARGRGRQTTPLTWIQPPVWAEDPHLAFLVQL